MRILLQMVLLALAAVLLAQAVEWNRDGVVSIFLSQTRVDIALNHFMLLCLLAFGAGYIALRLWGVLFRLPERAWLWRKQQREALALSQLVEGLEHWFAGRYVRAHKTWQPLLRNEKTGPVAHLLSAQARHAVQDSAGRDSHVRSVLEGLAGASDKDISTTAAAPAAAATPAATTFTGAGVRKSDLLDGLILMQAKWAERSGQLHQAMAALQQLQAGGARRTPALRQKLRLHQALRQFEPALETARLLARHRAFSPAVATSLLSSLIRQVLNDSSDGEKLKQFWLTLTSDEQARPQLLLVLAENYLRLAQSHTEANEPAITSMLAEAFSKLWVLWQQYDRLDPTWRAPLCQALIACCPSMKTQHLAHIEAAADSYSRDPYVQSLAGMVTKHFGLPGKAVQYLQRAQRLLPTAAYASCASTVLAGPAQHVFALLIWRALAELAEEQGDAPAALQAWKQAALLQPVPLPGSAARSTRGQH